MTSPAANTTGHGNKQQSRFSCLCQSTFQQELLVYSLDASNLFSKQQQQIRSTWHNLACNEPVRLLKSHHV